MEHDIGICLDGVVKWRTMCPRFVGTRGHLRIGLCGLPFLPDF